MSFNRRHKAILFITLVTTGCALLLGAELKDALGFMMLGAALAWAIGSDAASKLYSSLKGSSGSVYSWIRLPLVLTLAGAMVGALLLYSRGNPVAVVALSCLAGIFAAPFTPLPTKKIWLRVPIVLLAGFLFFLAAILMIETDVISNHKYGERFGELTATAFVAFLAGIFWLSKGWKLVVRGIGPLSSPEAAAIRSERQDSNVAAIHFGVCWPRRTYAVAVSFVLVCIWRLGLRPREVERKHSQGKAARSRRGKQISHEVNRVLLLLLRPDLRLFRSRINNTD